MLSLAALPGPNLLPSPMAREELDMGPFRAKLMEEGFTR